MASDNDEYLRNSEEVQNLKKSDYFFAKVVTIPTAKPDEAELRRLDPMRYATLDFEDEKVKSNFDRAMDLLAKKSFKEMPVTLVRQDAPASLFDNPVFATEVALTFSQDSKKSIDVMSNETNSTIFDVIFVFS